MQCDSTKALHAKKRLNALINSFSIFGSQTATFYKAALLE